MIALRLEIISRHRKSLGERSVKQFGHDGGTIGRSLESDWVLPDEQRLLSGRHASIDYRSGSYYLVDTSTNGVFVNDSDEPVGRGKPQRLFTDDRIRIGDYEMKVHVDETENTMETLAVKGHVDPVDRAQHVEAPDPITHDLVDATELTGVAIEMVLDEDEAKTVKPRVRAPARKKRKTKQTTAAKPSKRKAASSAQTTAADKHKAASNALGAFFRGAELKTRALDDEQVEQTLHCLGQLMREIVVGLTENLYLRAAQRNNLGQSNTTIQPRENNPLQFSAGVDEALENILFRQSEQYLSAVESVRAAFGNIKLHQQELLRSLEADTLDEKVSRGKANVG